jgi:hypothetical protein
MIRKGQVIGVPKGDIQAQLKFLAQILRIGCLKSPVHPGSLVCTPVFATQPFLFPSPRVLLPSA